MTQLDRASLDEVKDFCNKVREAGGANPLDSLLPATPCDPNACLIARNLNFSCQVQGGGFDIDDAIDEARSLGGYLSLTDESEQGLIDAPWFMYVADNDVRHRIAKALDLPLMNVADEEDYDSREAILLPARIGRVAHAFDDAVGLSVVPAEPNEAGAWELQTWKDDSYGPTGEWLKYVPPNPDLLAEMAPYIEESYFENRDFDFQAAAEAAKPE